MTQRLLNITGITIDTTDARDEQWSALPALVRLAVCEHRRTLHSLHLGAIVMLTVYPFLSWMLSRKTT